MGILSTIFTIVQILTVATGIKNIRDAKKLADRGQDILATKIPDGSKINTIYGTRRVGSTLVYMDTDSGDSKELFCVFALAVGEVESIDLQTIEINGTSINDTKVFRDGYYAGSDKIGSGAGSLNTASQIGDIQQTGSPATNPAQRARMVFNAHHGADDQTADPMLVASISKWTSAHRLRGIAYLACSFQYDRKGMFSSQPELTVVVKGKKVYDPRKDGSISGGTGSHRINDSSTFEWSDNAALCLLDYISNDSYGKGLSSSLIDMSSFQTAANTADTLVDTPDYSGSASAATFSGTSGDNFVSVDETTWKKVKGGSYITLRDSGASVELDYVDIVDMQRFKPHTESTQYKLFVGDTLSSSYSSEVGDALVKVRRFHCNGVIDNNENVLENTRELLKNCRGIFNYVNGKYVLQIEDTGSSTFSITDDHIIDDVDIKIKYEDKSTKYNKVVVSFFNAQKNYEADTVTVLHTSTPSHTTDDGGEELELKIQFDYVTNPYIAYNLGKAILGRSRNQKTISFAAVPELFKLTVGDIVDITYSGLGLSSNVYRIEAITLMENCLLNIQAIEYLDIYTWDSAPPAENVGALPDLPTGMEARPPTNLSFTDTNSSSTGRPFLSWTAATTYPAKEFRVIIEDSSNNEVHNRIVSNEFIDLAFLPIGSNYEAKVTSINTVGSESEEATLTFSVGDAPVLTADIKDSAVTSAKVLDDAITNAKLAVNSIQGDVIAAGAIVESKLGVDAVTSAKIAANAVNTSEIATGAITANEIASNAVTANKIISNAVSTDKLAANAVTAAKIAANTITASQIASGTITATQIAANTITGSNINVDTLNVKFFANTTSKIINHNSNAVPLTRFGSTFTTTANTGNSGTHTCADVTVTDCRSGGSFVAFATGVLGDVANFRVQFSVDGGSTYSNCANGITHTFDPNVYRPYTFIYADSLTFTGSNQTAKFRIIMVGDQNYTSIGLTVLVDNTN